MTLMSADKVVVTMKPHASTQLDRFDVNVIMDLPEMVLPAPMLMSVEMELIIVMPIQYVEI